MLFWKEWRETVAVVVLSLVAVSAASLIKWKGWRPEFFELQFWAGAMLFLPFAALMLGADAIARERERETFDNLLSRPVSRLRILTTKLAVRLGSVILVLAILTVLFHLLRPTHNVKLPELTKALVIFFSFLLFSLTISFSVSCLTDTSAKAFVAGTVAALIAVSVINATRFYKYTWWWTHSFQEMWFGYLAFYGILSLLLLAVAYGMFSRRVLINYKWRHLAIIGLFLFLIFLKSVSTTLWFFTDAISSGDLDLIQAARGSVREILATVSKNVNGEREQRLTWLLSATPSASVEQDLAKELADSDPAIRNMALRILTDRKAEKVGPIVVGLLNDPNPEVRHTALDYVQFLKCKEAVPRLIALLDGPNSSIRERAIIALAAIEEENACPYLMKSLDDPNPRVCSMAAVNLSRMDYAPAQPVIVKMMLENPVKHTREGAASFLGNMKSAPACEALMQALSSDNLRLVDNAIWSLGELRCENSTHLLLERLEKAHAIDEPATRQLSNRLVEALKKIGSDEVRHTFRELFADPTLDNATRMEIALSLREMGDATAIPFVRQVMLGEIKLDKYMRDLQYYYAVRLAEAGEYSAVPVLISRVAEERWPPDKFEYSRILTRLTGKEYGWDTRRWTRWWEKNKDELLSKPFEAKGEHRRG